MLESTRSVLETAERVLLRCWLLGMGLLLIWLAAAMFLRSIIYDMHGPMFGLTNHELDVIFYGGMGFLKILVLTFFFIPWLSIRLAPKKG